MGIFNYWSVERIKRKLRELKGFEIPVSQISLIRLKDFMRLDDRRSAETLDLDLQDGEMLQVVISDTSDSESSRSTPTLQHQCKLCDKYHLDWRSKNPCRKCYMKQARQDHSDDMAQQRVSRARPSSSGTHA